MQSAGARRRVCSNISTQKRPGGKMRHGLTSERVGERVCAHVCIEWCYTSEPCVRKETHGGKAVLHSLVFASVSNKGLLTLFGVSQCRPWLLAFFQKQQQKKNILFFFLSFL